MYIYKHTHYTFIITMHVYSLKMNVKDNSFVFHLKFCYTYILIQTTNINGHISAVMCCNASGRIIPTFLIFKKSMPTLNTDQAKDLQKNWTHAVSQAGKN